VGRARELGVLADAHDGCMRHGEPATVVVLGESGIGKTSLARRFVDERSRAQPEVVVLWGRCYERESVPFKAFDGVVDELSRYLARLPKGDAEPLVPAQVSPLVKVFPVLRRVHALARMVSGPLPALDPIELRARAFASLREILARLGDRQPLVVVIDDAHWADDDSLVLLTELLRPPDAPRMTMILTARSFSDSSATERTLSLALPQGARSLVVDRLPDAETRALAAQLLERTTTATGDAVDWLVRQGQGHPLFMETMARRSAEKPAVVSTAPFEEIVRDVVCALDAPAPAVAEIVAVAPAPLAQDVVMRAAELEGDAFARAVAALRAARLVQTTGSRSDDRIQAYHDRIRSSVLANLDAKRRADCHRRLALAMEASGEPDPEALVLHWRGSGEDARAARYAVIAADRASDALAFDRAASFYRLALDLRAASLADAEARALTVKLGNALAGASRGSLAAEQFELAAGAAPPAEALELRRRAGEQLMRSGHFDRGVAAMGAVLADVGLRMPTTPRGATVAFGLARLRLRLRGLRFRARDASEIATRDATRIDVCWSVALGLAFTDPVRGALFQTLHLLMSLRSGDRGRIALALAAEAGYRCIRADRAREDCQALCAKASALAREAASPYALAWATGAEGLVYCNSGYFRRSLELADAAMALYRDCPGTGWEATSTQFLASMALADLGELKELGRRVRAWLHEARERRDLYAIVKFSTGCPSLPRFADDEPERARLEARAAMSQLSTQWYAEWHGGRFHGLVTLVYADLYEGCAHEALDRFDAAWPTLRRSLLPWRVTSIRLLCRSMRGRAALAVCAVSKRSRATLLRAVERDASAIDAEPVLSARPLATLLRAGAAHARGERDRAVALLRDAIDGFDGAEMALQATVCRRVLGSLVGGDEGRTLSDASEAWMAGQGVKNPARMTELVAPGFCG
jgi:hypothetical protein